MHMNTVCWPTVQYVSVLYCGCCTVYNVSVYPIVGGLPDQYTNCMLLTIKFMYT